jgi:hypothetical protein
MSKPTFTSNGDSILEKLDVLGAAIAELHSHIRRQTDFWERLEKARSAWRSAHEK